jgi:hypothetical protein
MQGWVQIIPAAIRSAPVKLVVVSFMAFSPLGGFELPGT